MSDHGIMDDQLAVGYVRTATVSRKIVRNPRPDPNLSVGYVRTSTEFQYNSPSRQKLSIKRLAKHLGLKVVSWHSDIDVSGATPADERNGLSGALKDMREKGAGVLLLEDVDRLARDVAVHKDIERRVLKLGGTIKYASIDGKDRSVMNSFESVVMPELRKWMETTPQYRLMLVLQEFRDGCEPYADNNDAIGLLAYVKKSFEPVMK